MSAFNILHTELLCSNCKKKYPAQVQFKFGDTWQLEYKPGDEIKWGGNQISKPGNRKVLVYGVLQSDECPVCGVRIIEDEFDITIENDIITRIVTLKDIQIYLVDHAGYSVCND